MRSTPAAVLAAGLCSAPAAGGGVAPPGPLVVFVHDQGTDEILRLRDLNNDGDAHDPGEVTVFFDSTPGPLLGVNNAQGLVALDAWTLLATDNFDPDNVVLLRDADRNGSALDPGEATVWYDGVLPGLGVVMTNPVDLHRRSDGSYFLLDNNTLDTTRPEAVYILRDVNADDDVNDAGESSLFFALSPVGVSEATTFDVVEDVAGNVYVLDITDPNQIESIDVIDPAGAGRAEWLSSQTLFNLRNQVMGSTYELEYIPSRNEVLFGAFDLASNQLILAARDANLSGSINAPAEIRTVWSEASHADGFSTGSPRDFFRTPDGRLLWPDALQDRVMLMRHVNADADYQDAGETTVYFDAATATANGLPSLTLPLSISAVVLCPADLNADGAVNLDDLEAFATGFTGAGPQGDCDGSGALNVDDLDCFIAAFMAGCP